MPKTRLIVIFDTNEVIGAHAEKLYIIDPDTGALKYSYDKGTYAPQDGNWRRAPMYLVDRGELFLGGTVLDAQTGELIHKEERFDTAYPPTVTMDTMYLAALEDGVVAFDRIKYEIRWIYPAPQRKEGAGSLHTLSPVTILEGVGYVIFSDATLRAFDLLTGEELGYWQPERDELLEWPVCTFPSPRFDCIESARAGSTASDNMLFVSFGDGKLYAFDTEK